MKWPEERIRYELRQLDRKSGLNGSSLPIHFSNAISRLGSFHYSYDGKPLYFTFSRRYCENDQYPESQMINTIRHEYAHYMVCVRYPNLNERSHGRHWQKCCIEIGAEPLRLCNVTRDLRIRQQEKVQEEEASLVRSLITDLKLGDQVIHPIYGAGVISGVTPSADNPRISLSFPDGQKRMFPAKWILENCSF